MKNKDKEWFQEEYFTNHAYSSLYRINLEDEAKTHPYFFETGTNMGLGLLISFSYILFFQFSSTLATNGNLQAWIAVWIPNFLYIILGLLLLRNTQNS